MKVMRAPKMDVVRFTESDVIVASSTVDNKYYAYMNNWGGTARNASMSIVQNDITLSSYDWTAISSSESARLLNGITFGGTSIHELVEDESLDNPQLTGYNGTWVSTNGQAYSKYNGQ